LLKTAALLYIIIPKIINNQIDISKLTIRAFILAITMSIRAFMSDLITCPSY
jgi:hypothetical protein